MTTIEFTVEQIDAAFHLLNNVRGESFSDAAERAELIDNISRERLGQLLGQLVSKFANV